MYVRMYVYMLDVTYLCILCVYVHECEYTYRCLCSLCLCVGLFSQLRDDYPKSRHTRTADKDRDNPEGPYTQHTPSG